MKRELTLNESMQYATENILASMGTCSVAALLREAANVQEEASHLVRALFAAQRFGASEFTNQLDEVSAALDSARRTIDQLQERIAVAKADVEEAAKREQAAE